MCECVCVLDCTLHSLQYLGHSWLGGEVVCVLCPGLWRDAGGSSRVSQEEAQQQHTALMEESPLTASSWTARPH